MPASVIGVISGTSMDGVDVAHLMTDGEAHIERGPGISHPYSAAQREAIRAAMGDAMAAPDGASRTPLLDEAERAVTEAHCEAIARFIEQTGIAPDLIGWHGQTVAHAPERRFTMQIGDAALMASHFDVPVISDFRTADVLAGGQGAPLVPAYHRALARQAHLAEPVLVINLGGVANVTFIDHDALVAFDTGPASALIDDEMATTGAAFDAEGATAASGTVDEAVLMELMRHRYFAEPAPKSLDRDAFRAFAAGLVGTLGFADRIATLTAFTAESLAAGVRLFARRPQTVIAAGGGTHNRTMMRMIEERLGVPVRTADETGFSSDFMEAEAFAYLAVRSHLGLTYTYPGTTGVAAPHTGGQLSLPPDHREAASAEEAHPPH
ncbi:anhydro-N-acetylmuramic acid kinase [Acuticoccus mangrovi]|uniref:anhydro-N-acetylmuramic acid kinase n=1 Tax=Acuticoccus mangrovi TaxID=2796142 RepID=UPI002FC98FEE